MSFSTRTMQDTDWIHSPHFTKSEFTYPEKMGVGFILWLNAVRDKAGVPMTITSSYRTPAHNVAVGGAEDSAHMDVPCDAVDIGVRPRPEDPNWNYSRFQIVTAALALGCTRIGLYTDGSIHLDRTEGTRPSQRIWHVVDRPA